MKAVAKIRFEAASFSGAISETERDRTLEVSNSRFQRPSRKRKKNH